MFKRKGYIWNAGVLEKGVNTFRFRFRFLRNHIDLTLREWIV